MNTTLGYGWAIFMAGIMTKVVETEQQARQEVAKARQDVADACYDGDLGQVGIDFTIHYID